MQDFSDEQLIKAILAGNQMAANYLFEKYYDKLKQYVQRIQFQRGTWGHYEASDIVNEACMRALRDLGKFDISMNTPFFFWLKGYVDMIIKEYDRTYMRAANVSEIDDNMVSFHNDPADIVIHKEQIEVLRESFISLSPEYQAIIVMRLQDGLTCKECANILGRSEDACESLYRRAIKTLRQEFFARYNGCPV